MLQTGNNPAAPEYEFRQNSRTIGTAAMSLSGKRRVEIHLTLLSGNPLLLSFQPNAGEGALHRFRYQVLSHHGEAVGHIANRRKLSLNPPCCYAYTELGLGIYQYRSYEVNMGMDGRFYCVYREERLLAEILRPVGAPGGAPAYTIYCADRYELEAPDVRRRAGEKAVRQDKKQGAAGKA